MKRNYLTRRRGKKRPATDGLERILGVVHIGVTPWIEELKRTLAETGENPLKGRTRSSFNWRVGR